MNEIIIVLILSVTFVTLVGLHHILPYWLSTKFENLDENNHNLANENKILKSHLTSVAYHVSKNQLKEAMAILNNYK